MTDGEPTRVELWGHSQSELFDGVPWAERDWELYAVWENGEVVRGDWEGASDRTAEQLLREYDGPTIFALRPVDAPVDADTAEIH